MDSCLDGLSTPRIVEAVSEGVIIRNSIHPIFSDYSIILSPKGITDEERKGACLKANSLIGARYDVNFKFDIEEELKFYTGTHKDSAIHDLEVSKKSLEKYEPTFSCTEVVGYSWWHKREELRLFRSEQRGKSVLLPDCYLNHNWEIKWMSKSITLEVARENNLHEEGLLMIEKYLNSKKV